MTATAEPPLPELELPDSESLSQEFPAWIFFKPREDQPGRFDEQASFCNEELPGVAWLIAGNGAGSTTCALSKASRFLLHTPPPKHDTSYWVIAESYEQVMEAAWKEKLYGLGMIPSEVIDWGRIHWYKEKQEWPFRVPLKPWPGTNRNWVIEFKSYQQGRRQMQARAIGGFCFIEQFPWGILEEVLRGCREAKMNFPGSKICEFTPIDPALSVEIEELIEKDDLPAGWKVYRANTECALEAGHVSQQWFDEFFGMVSAELRETRTTGRFATYEGAVYKQFNPAIHLVGDDKINFPPNVFHYRAIDWGAGPDNAFCCLWFYRNGLGQFFFYDEYYSTDQGYTTIDHLCEVQDRWLWPKNNPHYGITFADPSSPDNIRSANKLQQYCPREEKLDDDGRPVKDDEGNTVLVPMYDNLPMRGAMNSVIEGIEHVQWLLKVDPALAIGSNGSSKGQPRLFIHKENCPNLARQMRTYRWVKASDRGDNPTNPRKEPLKRADHSCDALRYGCFSLAMTEGTAPTSWRKTQNLRSRGVHLAAR